MPCTALALLGHGVGPSMSSALRYSWLASTRARHTHSLCTLSILAAPHIRHRSSWKHQRQYNTAAGADNGSSASANDETFFATTPLYYVRPYIAICLSYTPPCNLSLTASLEPGSGLVCAGQCRASHGERLHHDGSGCHCQVPKVAREKSHPCHRSALLNNYAF